MQTSFSCTCACTRIKSVALSAVRVHLWASSSTARAVNSRCLVSVWRVFPCATSKLLAIQSRYPITHIYIYMRAGLASFCLAFPSTPFSLSLSDTLLYWIYTLCKGFVRASLRFHAWSSFSLFISRIIDCPLSSLGVRKAFQSTIQAWWSWRKW